MTDQSTNVRREAARSALSQSRDNDAAREVLREMMANDPAVYRAIMAPYEAEAITMALGYVRRDDRATIWRRPSGPDDRVAALANTNASAFFEMRLPNGKKLGDATQRDLIEAAQSYDDRAKYNQQKADFFRTVAERMKGRKTVRAQWTETELQNIRNAL